MSRICCVSHICDVGVFVLTGRLDIRRWIGYDQYFHRLERGLIARNM